jgi:hypothetical protein
MNDKIVWTYEEAKEAQKEGRLSDELEAAIIVFNNNKGLESFSGTYTVDKKVQMVFVTRDDSQKNQLIQALGIKPQQQQKPVHA